MTQSSPFSLNRFERERVHLYYLPEHVVQTLERNRQVYLIGSRGTGKTTLLQSLNWKERLDNTSLKHALNNNMFGGNYIGLYLQMPSFFLAHLNEWLKDRDIAISGPITGIYFDLIWVEVLVEALARLLIEGIFNASPSEEHDLVASVLEKNPELQDLENIENPCTLKQFYRIIHKIRRKLERLAQFREDPKDLHCFYTQWQVGEFGNSIASQFADFCDRYSDKGERGWHFKICMDEAECLSILQQRVLNTAVRLSKDAAVYVVSFVRHVDDISSTILPNLTLQRADRDIIYLDTMSDAEFKSLAEGVASVRVQSKLSFENINFKTTRVLGKLDINVLLNKILNESESPVAKRLLQDAKEFSDSPFGMKLGSKESNGSEGKSRLAKPLPIYQTYIVQKLKIKVPSPDDEKWKKRSQESSQIRKRNVAAYLCLCKELGVNVRYAFDQMVLGMSDKCIRDFLAQIHEIYIESALPLEDFVKGKGISVEMQNRALQRASIYKKQSLPKSGVTAPDKIGRIFDGLGQVTAAIQSSGPDNIALRVSERGQFVVDTRSLALHNSSELLVLVKEAAEAGFLKFLSTEGEKWVFQVHRSLAAAYGFSYRGPYYYCQLFPPELEELICTEDKLKYKSVVSKLISRISGESAYQTTMF